MTSKRMLESSLRLSLATRIVVFYEWTVKCIPWKGALLIQDDDPSGCVRVPQASVFGSRTMFLVARML